MNNNELFKLLNIEYLSEIDSNSLILSEEHIEKLDEKFLRDNRIVPYKIEDSLVTVLTSDPESVNLSKQLKYIFNKEIKVIGTDDDNITLILNHIVEKNLASSKTNIEIEEYQISDSSDSLIEDILEKASKVPVIKWVNSTIQKAIYKNATDIHIEPYEKIVAVRFRVDGVLYEEEKLTKNLLQPIISRIKIMSKLDIAEQRLPQDGKIRIKSSDKEFDIRVSILPTVYGERVVLRLLDKNKEFLSFEELGFNKSDIANISKLLNYKNGIIFVTGPTGSGKTTTLYSFLMKLNDRKKNIMTVEDPVEYQIDGVNQMNIKPEIDLTFSTGLRHILRQDPDIIMIGEVRDYETAEIAIRSSLTGHLVFSTLHTNDSVSAITRLIDMNVPSYLIASTIRGILAQRLVRKLCFNCRQKHQKYYIAKGCEKCNNIGYKGRTAVYELFICNQEISEIIHHNYSESKLKEYLNKTGFESIISNGQKKVEAGITTKEEVLNIL